jgi:hypothetical protein
VQGESEGGAEAGVVLGGERLDAALVRVSEEQDGAFEEAFEILGRVHVLVPVRGEPVESDSVSLPVVEIPEFGLAVPAFTNTDRLADFVRRIGWMGDSREIPYVAMRSQILFDAACSSEVDGVILDAAGPVPLLLPVDLLEDLTAGESGEPEADTP